MMDISDIINDPDFSFKYPFKRVYFSINNGRFTVDKISDINILCAVVPNVSLTRHTGNFLIENVSGKIAIYSKDNLYGMAIDEVNDKSVIDFVKFNGRWWQVEEVRTWNDFGFNIGYAKMYETQGLYMELDNELR